MFLHFFQQFHLSSKSLTTNNHSSSSFNLFFHGSHHILFLCLHHSLRLQLKTTKRNLCFYVFNSQQVATSPPNKTKNSPFPHHPIKKKKRVHVVNTRRISPHVLLLFSEKTKESNQASSKLKSRPKLVKKGTSADLLFQRVELDTKFASKHVDLSMSECFVLLVLSFRTTLVFFFSSSFLP